MEVLDGLGVLRQMLLILCGEDSQKLRWSTMIINIHQRSTIIYSSIFNLYSTMITILEKGLQPHHHHPLAGHEIYPVVILKNNGTGDPLEV